MKTGAISAFMLERYKLGELSPEDQRTVAEALKTDDELRSRLEQLDNSDRELRQLYPADFFGLENPRQRHFVRSRIVTRVRYAGLAAVIAAGIILPILYVAFFKNDRMAHNEIDLSNGMSIATASQDFQGTDRTKGRTLEGSELSLFLKGDREIGLSNQTVLEEGNTVQLAYTVPAGAEHYGVIFSVDGRAAVTMHYPYRKGQSSLLVSGKRTFLNEAYILDDAPKYEIFVMVVSEQPLDVDAVLREAHSIAAEKDSAAFGDCEVETITILKK